MIETAVLGTGYGLATYAKALSVHPHYNLSLVFSRDNQRAKEARKDFGFRKATDNWEDACNDPDIKLICIATPPHTHFEIAKKALLSGKNVICSAPFTVNLKEAEELNQIALEKNLLGVVDHHTNYLPARKFVQRLLMDGKIGKLTHIERVYRDNSLFNTDALPLWKMQRSLMGGSFGVLGGLEIDYLLRIAGGIKSTKANLFISHPLRETLKNELLENNADDSFSLVLEFHSGVHAQIHVSQSYIGKTQDEYLFHGHNGSLHFINNSDLIFYDIKTGKRERLALPPAYQLANIPGSYQTAAFYMLLEIFSSSLFHHTPISPTFEEAIHIQRVLDASYISAETNTISFIGDEESAPVKPHIDEIVVKKIYD